MRQKIRPLADQTLTSELGIAVEEQKPNGAHNQLDRQIEKKHRAWHAVDDETEDSPECQRVSEKHCPDHCHPTPLRRERSDEAEDHHAEIEAHKSPENMGLIGAFHREVHEWGNRLCRIDS